MFIYKLLLYFNNARKKELTTHRSVIFLY